MSLAALNSRLVDHLDWVRARTDAQIVAFVPSPFATDPGMYEWVLAGRALGGSHYDYATTTPNLWPILAPGGRRPKSGDPTGS